VNGKLAAFIAIEWNQERTANLVGRRKEDEQKARRSSTATAQLATRYPKRRSNCPNVCG
jgi:hypothetical protein